MKHFNDEDYDSMKEYECSIMHHEDDYTSDDYDSSLVFGHYIDEDNQDDEEGDGGNGQRRYQAHHLLNDIKSQIFILQPNVMTNQLYELTYSLYVLVVRKQSCLFFNL